MKRINNSQQAYDLLKPIFEEARRKGCSFRYLLENYYQKADYLFDNYIDEQFNHRYKNNLLMQTMLIGKIGKYLEDSNKLSPTVIENAIEDSKEFFKGKSTFVVPINGECKLKNDHLKINENLAICKIQYLLSLSQSLSSSDFDKLKKYGNRHPLFLIVKMDGKEALLPSHSQAVTIATDFCDLFNVATFPFKKGLNNFQLSVDKKIEDYYDFISNPFLMIQEGKIHWARWKLQTEGSDFNSQHKTYPKVIYLEEILNKSKLITWFKYLSPTFPEVFYEKENKYSLIKQAIIWLSESLNDNNATNSFLKLIIALDVLLERKSKFKKGEDIYHQLDENTDLILNLNNKEANEFFRNMSKAYKIRSEIVHNGYTKGFGNSLYKYLFSKSKEIINTLLLSNKFSKLTKTEEVYQMLDNIEAQRIKFLIREIIFALQKANEESLSMKALKMGMSDDYRKYQGTEWFWIKITKNNGFYILNDWLIYKAIRRLKNSNIIVEENNNFYLTEIGKSLNVKNIRFKAALDSILKNSDNKKKS